MSFPEFTVQSTVGMPHALTPAVEAGSAKAVNIVLMGHFAAHTEIPKEKWMKALEKTVPAKFLEMNRKAFDLGYGA